MKTTLSKTLLCGIMASTFLLANCQKAPSGRSVKAQVGKAGEVTPEQKVTPVDKDLNVVLCSSEFLKAYDEYSKVLQNAGQEVAGVGEVTEVRKANLLRFRKELEDKVKPTINEIKNLKSEVKDKLGQLKQVDGCYRDASKKTVYMIKGINEELNSLDIKIAELTKEDSDRSKSAVLAKKKAEQESKKEKEGTVFIVSEELNELFLEPHSSTNKHFVDGKIAEKSEFENNNKDLKAAVCELTFTSGKLEANEMKLRTMGVQPAQQVNKKNIFKLALAQLANQGDKTYNILCSLPIQLKIEDAFVKAMGKYLIIQSNVQTQESIDADEQTRLLARSKAASTDQTNESKTTEGNAEKSKLDADAAVEKAEAKDMIVDAERIKRAAAAAEEARISADVEQSGT